MVEKEQNCGIISNIRNSILDEVKSNKKKSKHKQRKVLFQIIKQEQTETENNAKETTFILKYDTPKLKTCSLRSLQPFL